MIFIFGISSGNKKLDQTQTVICPCCSQYGRLEVYMTYQCFTLFFIPVLRWNRQYFVRTSCCGHSAPLDKETGQRLFRGEEVPIREDQLQFDGVSGRTDTCPHCQYELEAGFTYCPGCGRKL